MITNPNLLIAQSGASSSLPLLILAFTGILALAVCVLLCVVVLVLLRDLREQRRITDELRGTAPSPRRRSAPARKQAAPSEAPSSPATASAPPVQQEDPALPAVLAAACVAALGRPVRIRSIQPVPVRNSRWAEAGRLSLHASHSFRKARS